jgi:signal transduction histidine kinase
MFGALSLLERQVSGEMKGAAIVTPAKDNSPFGRFGALTRIMNVGLLVLDSTSALEFANPLACDLLGCANEEDLKGRWETMKPLLGLDKDLPQTAKPRPLKVNLPLPDKIRFLRLEIYALEEESCTGYLVLMKDRQMVDVLETDLLLASQMRAQMYLHGALAHDLRAPLNAIQITLELLAETDGQGVDPSSQQRYITVLKQELTRLNRTLATMFDNHMPSLGTASEEFDLRAMVEEVTALLNTQAMRHRVDLQYRLADREVRMIGQRDRLKQALINVVINGLEAMPGGGRLRIDMVVQDASVDIIVRDDGSGIADELIDEIYQIDFTTKKSDSGMGLYVARLVLESHGGDIQVVNQPGSGACFTLTLPLAEKPGAR